MIENLGATLVLLFGKFELKSIKIGLFRMHRHFRQRNLKIGQFHDFKKVLFSKIPHFHFFPNFFFFFRLKSLIVCNNHISRILNIGDSLINLENLSLMNNKLSSLQDIDNLGSCKKLIRLFLNNNQVTQVKLIFFLIFIAKT